MSDKDKYTRDSDVRFTLRIEKDLFEKVKASAIKNKRAIGREIAYQLERFFEDLEKH